MITNREQTGVPMTERQVTLLSIFSDLYDGKSVEEIKSHFDQKIGKVTVEEVAQISQLQRDILESKNMSESEVKRLSAAHMSIIEGNIEESHQPQNEPGHPIHTFKLENREIEKLIQTKIQLYIQLFELDDSYEAVFKLIEGCNLLKDLDKHYSRKEQLLFPYLEKYGINGPSINMWRMDDFIRDAVKEAKQKLLHYEGNKQQIVEKNISSFLWL